MDPVCVLLALPNVMYNFLYRKPRSITEALIYYGGSMVSPCPYTHAIPAALPCFRRLPKIPLSVVVAARHHGASAHETLLLLCIQKQEITIHQTLRRQFWWYEGILFLEDIRCPVFFHLSGSDEIVPSEAVRAYIDRYCQAHHNQEHEDHRLKHPFENEVSDQQRP